MNLVNSLARQVTDRMPKSLGPTSYAVADYILLAGTVAAATYLFRRNRTAGRAL